jgi:hypothetical protein
MKEERTIKELLQLMLEHQELFRKGLCNWKAVLFHKNIITINESISLAMFIDDNRPKNFYWLIKDNYHWKPDNIKPRIKWIKKHIARL